MISFNELTPIQQKRYLENSKGKTLRFPNDFTYEYTLEGHDYWWNLLHKPQLKLSYLR